MVILLVFGLVNLTVPHAPDVLTVYALNGAVLTLLFRAPQRVLLTVGLVVGFGADLASTSGTVSDFTPAPESTRFSWLATGVAVQSFGHTVLGCWALRAGLLTDEQHVPAIRKHFVVTGIAMIALWVWALSLSDTPSCRPSPTSAGSCCCRARTGFAPRCRHCSATAAWRSQATSPTRSSGS